MIWIFSMIQVFGLKCTSVRIYASVKECIGQFFSANNRTGRLELLKINPKSTDMMFILFCFAFDTKVFLHLVFMFVWCEFENRVRCERVYNADETDLIYNALPTKTITSCSVKYAILFKCVSNVWQQWFMQSKRKQPKPTLKTSHVIFRTTNTTSLIQPIDQLVIETMIDYAAISLIDYWEVYKFETIRQ